MKKLTAFICSEPGNEDIVEKFESVIEYIKDWTDHYSYDLPAGVIVFDTIDEVENAFNDDEDDEDSYDFDGLRNWMKENGIDVII